MRGPGRSAARDGLATTGARPTDLTGAGMHGEQASPARPVGQEGGKTGPPNGMATSRRAAAISRRAAAISRRALVTSRRVPADSRGISATPRWAPAASCRVLATSRGSGTVTPGHATAADSGSSARHGTVAPVDAAAPLDATAFFGATVSTGDNSRPPQSSVNPPPHPRQHPDRSDTAIPLGTIAGIGATARSSPTTRLNSTAPVPRPRFPCSPHRPLRAPSR